VWKATNKTKTSLSKPEFALAKKTRLKEIKKANVDGKIPPELAISWDQTEVNVVPSSQRIQAEKGSSHVEIARVEDNTKL